MAVQVMLTAPTSLPRLQPAQVPHDLDITTRWCDHQRGRQQGGSGYSNGDVLIVTGGNWVLKFQLEACQA